MFKNKLFLVFFPFTIVLSLVTSVLALPDAEVQKIKSLDPLFAYVEDIIVDNWRNYPKQFKNKVYKSQIEWVKFYRDSEADYFIEKGLSKVDSYIICTAIRNNYLVEILPYNQRYKYIIIDIKALMKKLIERRSSLSNSNDHDEQLNKNNQIVIPSQSIEPIQISEVENKYNNVYIFNIKISDIKVYWLIIAIIMFICLMSLQSYDPIRKIG